MLAVWPAWFIVHWTVAAWFGTRDDLRPSDVAVVFGNGITPDGQPRPILKERLDRAIELYRAGLFELIVVSGSTADGGYDEPRVMRNYLLANGVPAGAIVEDPQGFNTYLTCAHTSEIMQQRGHGSVTVISQSWHIPRIRVAMWRMGVHDVRSAAAAGRTGWTQPYQLVREFAGFYWYLLRPYPEL